PSVGDKWSVQLAQLNETEWTAAVRALGPHLAQASEKGMLVLSLYVPDQGPELQTVKLFQSLVSLQSALSQLQQTSGLQEVQLFTRALTHSQPHYLLQVSCAPAPGVSTAPLPVLGQTPGLYQEGLAANAALHYRVQVSATQRALQDSALSAQQDLMLEKVPDSPYYRYTLGSTSTYAAAQDLQKSLLAQGWRGAYIVAYIYGRRVSKGQAREYLSYFPDLARYLGR
ncbi:MAG: hypothetical protein D6772_06635, partial [Bacteroidetes bacterium]